MEPGSVDLSGDLDVALRLMASSEEWRLRTVEQISVDTARFATRHRSLMVEPLQGVIGVDGARVQQARVALPIERLPKAPLLGYDVTVDGHPAYVVPRGATAEIEAAHVIRLAEDEGVGTTEGVAEFIKAIAEFTPYPWVRVRRRHVFFRRALLVYLQEGLALLSPAQPSQQSRTDRAREWLESAIVVPFALWLLKRFPGLRGRYPWTPRAPRTPFALSPRQVKDLRTQSGTIGGILRSALGEGQSRTSSADNPLLAVPLLAQTDHISQWSDIPKAVHALHTFVEDLARQVSHPRESAALVALADFGRRWETVVYCDVPLDRPFVVTSQRQVPVRVAKWGSWVRQPVEIRDARSNHIVIRVRDEAAEIARAELRGLDDERLEHTLLNGLARSSEHYALYSSEPDRDRRGTINIRLKVARSIRFSATVIHVITWVSVGITAYLGFRHSLDSSALAVVVVPTTFGAALVLTRERTSLARRLQWVTRWGTPLAVLALWVVVAWLYLGHYVGSK